jgi:hypothetical protein
MLKGSVVASVGAERGSCDACDARDAVSDSLAQLNQVDFGFLIVVAPIGRMDVQAALHSSGHDYVITDFIVHADAKLLLLSATSEDAFDVGPDLIEAVEHATRVELRGEPFEDSSAWVRVFHPNVPILGATDNTMRSVRYDWPSIARELATLERSATNFHKRSPERVVLGFRRARPFHPARLSALFDVWPAGVVRTLGTIWLATRAEQAIELDQKGRACFEMRAEGEWLARLSADELLEVRRQRPDLLTHWDARYGDRATSLVVAGRDFDPCALEQALEACVLTDLELRRSWGVLTDPFPFLNDETVAPSPHLRLLGSKEREEP